MVATAAPLIPIKEIKIGSPMILMIAPVNIAAIATLGLPSARMMEARQFCAKASGIIA